MNAAKWALSNANSRRVSTFFRSLTQIFDRESFLFRFNAKDALRNNFTDEISHPSTDKSEGEPSATNLRLVHRPAERFVQLQAAGGEERLPDPSVHDRERNELVEGRRRHGDDHRARDPSDPPQRHPDEPLPTNRRSGDPEEFHDVVGLRNIHDDHQRT